MTNPVVWTIAGSDSSSCAGIQADMRTFHALGVYACSIITALTAQSMQAVEQVYYVPADAVLAQMTALQLSSIPRVIKIGMLGNKEIIDTVRTFLSQSNYLTVLDPVLLSTSGQALCSGEVNTYIHDLKTMFPFVSVLTPNLPEAEKILGRKLGSYNEIPRAAEDILSFGVKSVFIKGGHFHQDGFSQDYWTDGSQSFWISSPRNRSIHMRGTGCTLSSALAACLALGYDVPNALVIAKMYLNQVIRLSETFISPHVVIQPSWPETSVDLPRITRCPINKTPESFPDCGKNSLGLYPIVDSAKWVKKLLPLGISTIQLRIKNLNGLDLKKEIQQAIHIAVTYQARLFINDYWELAIQYGAYGVHLGQEDLEHADCIAIRNAGLRLGISTHNYYEVACAHALCPSYIACGPIFPTTSKLMSHPPQGLEQLKRWRRTLHYPLVAIGGIGAVQLSSIFATGVNGVAMISAIIQAKDVENSVRKMHMHCLT